MAGKKYNITENSLKNAVIESLNEFFDRDMMDQMKSFGINDPSEKYTVDEREVKMRCNAFIQKCQEFQQVLREFDMYVNGVEEEAESGAEGTRGARTNIRLRNMFGARDINDQFLEESLDALDDALRHLNSAVEDAIDAAGSC